MIAGSDPPPSSEQTFADVLNALTFGGQRTGGQGAGGQGTGGQGTGGQGGGNHNVGGQRAGSRRGVTQRAGGRAKRRPRVAGATTPDQPNPIAAIAPAPPPAEPDQEPAAEAAIVRPYAWTRGRTRSAVELRVETLVSTADPHDSFAPPEHHRIAELCRTPRSVAEVAAALALPLGVAKVLIGDLATSGSLTVHGTIASAGSREHLMLMERVLSGLRRL
ncbi:MAG TPA: DUF742 domain-containing protein [Pseudonocardiaceae bacterium]|jgi:hypothetical protein